MVSTRLGRGAVELRGTVRSARARLGRHLRGLGRRASAATMSSLPPPRDLHAARDVDARAARSAGARARARPPAASVGSTSRRSQASTSRISARSKNAASPTTRRAIARSSSATATAWPSPVIAGDEHRDPPRLHVLAGQQPLDVNRHGLGLRAITAGCSAL